MDNNKSEECAISDLIEWAANEILRIDDCDKVYKTLINDGVNSLIACRIILFLPSAFAREYYEPMGIAFPGEFTYGPKYDIKTGTYESEPIYGHARELARKWQNESKMQQFIRIMTLSAEHNAIEEIKSKGKTPKVIGKVHHGFIR